MRPRWLRPLAIVALAACNSAQMSKPSPLDGGTSTPTPTLVTPADGSRLKATWFVTADGQRDFAGWYDTVLKTTCRVLRAIDGELRCLPATFPVGDVFADETCSQPLYVRETGICEPRYAYLRATVQPNACPSEQGLYRVTDRHTGPVFSRTSVVTATDVKDACRSGTVRADREVYRTEPVAPAELAEVQLMAP